MNNNSSAKDFRWRAREALKGNWLMVVLTTLVASIFGASVGVGNKGLSSIQLVSNIGRHTNQESSVTFQIDNGYLDPYNDQMISIFAGVFAVMVTVGLIIILISILIGSVVSLGLCQYNLKLIDGELADIGILFSNFGNWSKAVWLMIRKGLFIFLWSLLLVIPGIIKSYAYAMSVFILSENPEISPKEAMEISQKMMKGNKWRLFCLQLSFIGWDILNMFTLGIGGLWLGPYKNAASAAFYDEVSRKPVDHVDNTENNYF